MPCDTCAFILVKQGIANILYLLFRLLSRRIGFFLFVFPFCLDLLCDGQAFLLADFLRYPCCPVAYKGGIIDLSIKADTIGNNMDMPCRCPCALQPPIGGCQVPFAWQTDEQSSSIQKQAVSSRPAVRYLFRCGGTCSCTVCCSR